MNKIFLMFLLCCPLLLSAQVEQEVSDSTQSVFDQWEEKLIQLGHILLKDTVKANRIQASEDIKTSLAVVLTMEGSFDYPFDSLRSLSILAPSDSTFRIFTWQLYENVDTYTYSGLIQTNAPQPVVHLLDDQSAEMEELETDILEKDGWYGALYYNIKGFEIASGKYYFLFGFDGYQFFNKRKLIDVLSFEDGQPIFGAPVFEPAEPNRPDLTKSRLVLTYSAETTIRLNYDETLGLIIFDNLLVGGGSVRGQGPTMLPDGSYSGYKFDNNRWAFVEKIFDHVYDKAPVPMPVLKDRKGKDVFGNR